MKKILIFFTFIFFPFTSMLSITSCSIINHKNITSILEPEIGNELFGNVNITFGNIDDIKNHNYLVLKNYKNNLNNFYNSLYDPITDIIKPKFQNFFISIGYSKKDVTTTPNLLKYLKINLDKKRGIANLGLIFSGFSTSVIASEGLTKITLNNIRIYSDFTDVIYGVHKIFYYEKRKNNIGIPEQNIYLPFAKDNINNVSKPDKNDPDFKNKMIKYLYSKINKLYLNLWFDYAGNPGTVDNLLVSGTRLTTIVNRSNGLIVSKYNPLNFIVIALLGRYSLSYTLYDSNNNIIKISAGTKLKVGETLYIKYSANFLIGDFYFNLPLKILR